MSSLTIAMPRVQNVKKRNYKKSNFTKKPKKSITKQLVKTQVEKKVLDTGGVGTALVANTFSLFQPMNLVGMGPNGNERIGRKLLMKSVDLRLSCTPTALPTPVRVIIVYDKSGNNGSVTAPLSTDILQAADFDALMNSDRSERFVTLMDCIYGPSSITGAPLSLREFRKINLETQFTNTSAPTTIDEITKGTLLFGACSVLASTISFKCRVRYTDV